MSEITKEELLAMIDVQSKTATSMENIANSMRQISEQSKEMMSAQKSIVDGCAQCRVQTCEKLIVAVDKKLDEKTSSLADTKATIKDIAKDTYWLKIILGSATFIILIATVVVNMVTRNWALEKQTKDMETKIHQMMDKK